MRFSSSNVPDAFAVLLLVASKEREVNPTPLSCLQRSAIEREIVPDTIWFLQAGRSLMARRDRTCAEVIKLEKNGP